MGLARITRALISVSNKDGLVELAAALRRHGIEILSTGGTYRALQESNIQVTEVASYTGFPEMLDGRVKTLHPKIHGGILHRRDIPAHRKAVEEHQIPPIDLVVVNLYPFEETVAKQGVTWDEAIEQIDIGGPSMIRSAAKNHSHVGVLTDPSQYATLIQSLDENKGSLPTDLLREWAIAAFRRTAEYDAAIHRHLSTFGSSEGSADPFPDRLVLEYERAETLRYGENPHQQAAFYVDRHYKPANLGRASKLHGKELSYNNILDLDSCLSLVREFTQPAAVVVKHNNPCGAAVASTLHDAFLQAYAGDPLSAFGGVIGFNNEVDQATAEALAEPGRFVEAIVAPSFSKSAIDVLTTRPSWKSSVRLVEVGDLFGHENLRVSIPLSRPIEGGLLRQSPDLGDDGWDERKVVTQRSPTEEELNSLRFAWTVVKHVRSNAIVIAKENAIIGVGAGQMSRVDSVRIAWNKAGDRSKGAVLASDAFFPFPDNIDLAAEAGIAAIIQPGGSKKDQDSIDACNKHGIAMIFTGKRHFKH